MGEVNEKWFDLAFEDRLYKGLVVTSIDYTKRDGDKVTFTEKDHNKDNCAVFLTDIKQTNRTDVEGDRTFEAKLVHPENSGELQRFIPYGIPLFIMHGYNVEPGYALFAKHASYNVALKKFAKNKKHYPVPVLWASDAVQRGGGFDGFFFDKRHRAINAGDKLYKLVNQLGPKKLFPRKSLLMHSMGNHAVFNGACNEGAPNTKFENIFMVSAELAFDSFNERVNEAYFQLWRQKTLKDKKKKASNMFAMLATEPDGTPKGKIYICSHQNDNVLWGSSHYIVNNEYRLGQNGACTYPRNWHGKRNYKWPSFNPDPKQAKFKGFVENKAFTNERTSDQDLTGDDDWWGSIPGISGPKNHSYQFDDFAIDFYDAACL